MPKRRLHHLILLLTLIFGSVAPAWAGTGSQEAGRLTWVNSRSSLHLFVSKSFKQVGVVEIGVPTYVAVGVGVFVIAGAILAPEVVIPLLLSQPVVWGGVAYSAYAIGKQVYDVHNGDQDRIHYGTMALDAVGLIPLAGVVAKSVRAGWMGASARMSASIDESLSFGPMTYVDEAAGLSKDFKLYKYNMVENPGPLAEMRNNPAANFSGGQYNATELLEDLVLYRGGASGGGKKAYGQWFTRDAPASIANVRIDSAVKAHWLDGSGGHLGSSPINVFYKFKIPKGTTIYEGPVGYMDGPYLGGGNQIFIPSPWDIRGIKVLGEIPLR